MIQTFSKQQMKTLSFIVLLLCINFALGLKAREQAHVLMGGRIGGTVNHDLRRVEQHEIEKPFQQHDQGLQNHDGNSYSSSSDWNNGHKLVATENHDKNQNHEFGPSSSTSYHEHEKMQNHNIERNHELFGRAESRPHNYQLNSQTSSYTSSSDFKHEEKYAHQLAHQQSTKHNLQEIAHEGNSYSSSSDFTHLEQNQQSHEVKQHQLESATSSYTSSSDFAHDEGLKARHHQNEIHDEGLKTRSHQNEIHDEYDNDQTGNDQTGDQNDQLGDQYDDNGNLNYQTGHGTGKFIEQHKQNDLDQPNNGVITREEDQDDQDQANDLYYKYKQNLNDPNNDNTFFQHKQNDVEEPNNGDKYYYVNDDDVRKGMQEEDTSSLSSVNVRDYVDYNKPLNPPGQKNQAANNDADTDTDSQTSSGKVFFEKKTNSHLNKEQTHEGETSESSTSTSVSLHDPNNDQYLIQHQQNIPQTDHQLAGTQNQQADHEKIMWNKNKFMINHQADANADDINGDDTNGQSDDNVNDQYNNSPLYTRDDSHKHRRRNSIQ